MNKIYTYLAVFISILMVFTSCKSRSSNDEDFDEEEIVYPITIIGDTITADLADQSELYPVGETFLEDFIEKIAEYEGKHLTIASKVPGEWGVSCVERLPEGRELWLLRSQDREWAYLVITSGFGTQRILDLIPVAVNLAIQDNDILETENWQTYRQSDGSFYVYKNYEWIKNLDTNATQHAIGEYQRNAFYVDRYVINDLCRFECTEINDSVPEYSAVVFFYNSSLKPDEWDDTVEMLQAFCEDKGVYYEEVQQGFADVAIHDFTLNEVIRVDVTPFAQEFSAGMVMFKKGETPKAVRFGSYERMQIDIKRYFNLLNI
ncbi:MAG: hypothetical protein MJZ72_01280 [Bacteroidales bacterium]|nr:hypothetical protein [Bacteroidales bacterium]